MIVESEGGASDLSIFSLFSYQFIKGDPKTALDNPHSIVMTESTARKYIGDEDQPIRIVVFQYQGRIFELSAMPAKKVGGGKVDTEELFRIQQSVLSSIK